MIEKIFFGSISSLFIIISLKYIKNILKTYLSKVDSNTQEHGGVIVAEVLKAHNVKHIFTLCGGHISPILIASEKMDIQVIAVRHEANAVFAADAVARSGEATIGVAAVTAGPGLTNTITALKNAQMAESPVLLLAGAAASALKGRGALQDIDQMGLVSGLVKYSATITRVQDIASVLCEAIRIARSDTPGPVFVEFPIDSLYPYPMVRREMGIIEKPRNIKQKLVNIYLEYYLRNLFGNAFRSSTLINPLPISIPTAKFTHLQQIVEMIHISHKPLILFGSQAVIPPVVPSELISAIKILNIPCYLGGMSRGLLGASSPLQFKQNRKEALAEADLIILAGTVCDFRLGYGRSLNKKAKIISINRTKENLYKNSDMFWRPTLAIQADVATTLCDVSKLWQQMKIEGNNIVAWIGLLREREIVKDQLNENKATVQPQVHLNPLNVLLALDKVLDNDKTILVADGGDFVGSAAYILRPRGPRTWLDPGVFGTLGVGGGFALGIKMMRPKDDVWIIYGDGSLGYTLAEFDTFVRYKVGVIAIVGNDACWSQISREQVPMFGSNIGCQLEYTDYHKSVESLGGRGFLLNRDNVHEAADVFKEALNLSRQGIPVLINCLIGQSDFRQGSISV